MSTRSWVVLLAVGLSGAVAHTFLPAGPGMLTYVAVGVISVSAMLLGIRRHHLEPAGPWLLIAAGLALSMIADLIWYGYDLLLDIDTFPSIADVLYLLAYPAHACGLAWLIQLRNGHTDRATAIDAAIVTVGAGVLSWVYLVVPAASDVSLSLLARLIAGAYPVADLLILAVFVRLLFTPGGTTPAFGLLGLSFVAILGADVIFGATTLTELPLLTRISDTLYALSYPLAGAAVLHPSVNQIVLPGSGERPTLTRWRLLLLAGAALFAPGLLAVQTLTRQSISGLAIAIGSAIVFLLVVVRMRELIREVETRAADVERMARRDPLTGVTNRRGWDEQLAIELERARRSMAPLSVALLDLDHFKDYNDRYGHQAGDELLCDLTAAWKEDMRTGDVLARYGGEEFGLILPASAAREALRLVDRLRSRVPGSQTCSAGIAIWDGKSTVAELVRRTDAALYEAKRAGRDRSVMATDVLHPHP